MFNMKNFKISIVASLMAVTSFSALAEDTQDIKDLIVENQPQFQGANIRVNQELSEYGLEGFHSVNIQGQDLVLTPDGRYAILGDLFDLSQMRNITEESRSAAMGERAGGVISGMDKDGFIKFSHNDDVEHIGDMYVFTDPTCPFCTRVHQEMEEYKTAGVNVYYIPYPRSGINANGRDYQMLTRALCSDNPQEALNAYKNQDASVISELDLIDGSACHDTVAAGYNAGQEIGVSGTPFIYLSNGDAIPGYNPAESIISRLK